MTNVVADWRRSGTEKLTKKLNNEATWKYFEHKKSLANNNSSEK